MLRPLTSSKILNVSKTPRSPLRWRKHWKHETSQDSIRNVSSKKNIGLNIFNASKVNREQIREVRSQTVSTTPISFGQARLDSKHWDPSKLARQDEEGRSKRISLAAINPYDEAEMRINFRTI